MIETGFDMVGAVIDCLFDRRDDDRDDDDKFAPDFSRAERVPEDMN